MAKKIKEEVPKKVAKSIKPKAKKVVATKKLTSKQVHKAEEKVESPLSQEQTDHVKAVAVDEVIKESIEEVKHNQPFIQQIPSMQEAIERIEGKPVVDEKVIREKVGNRPLSEQALSWSKYLKLQGITPEQFLKQYPTHRMRSFVEELYEHEKKLENKL